MERANAFLLESHRTHSFLISRPHPPLGGPICQRSARFDDRLPAQPYRQVTFRTCRGIMTEGYTRLDTLSLFNASSLSKPAGNKVSLPNRRRGTPSLQPMAGLRSSGEGSSAWDLLCLVVLARAAHSEARGSSCFHDWRARP